MSPLPFAHFQVNNSTDNLDDGGCYSNQFAMLIFTDVIKIFQFLGAVDEKHPIEVIDFMVHHDSIEALVYLIEGVATFIQAGHAQIMRTAGLPIQTWKAETTIEVFAIITGVDDPWVDQGDGWHRFTAAIARPP